MAAGGERGGERGIPVEKVSKFLSFGRIAGQIDSIEFPEEKSSTSGEKEMVRTYFYCRMKMESEKRFMKKRGKTFP